jgi:predicted nucleic acid-binding protein
VKQRFYIDTSVFGGLFDKEFEEETTLLFEKIELGQVICVYSNLTESELSNAPLKVRQYFENINDNQKEKIQITQDILSLALTYVKEKVVGETSLDDCIHIAAATISKLAFTLKTDTTDNKRTEK